MYLGLDGSAWTDLINGLRGLTRKRMNILYLSVGSHGKEGGIQFFEKVVYRILLERNPSINIHYQILMDQGSAEQGVLRGGCGGTIPFTNWKGYSGNRIRFIRETVALALRKKWDWVFCGHANLTPICRLINLLGGPRFLLFVYYLELVTGVSIIRRYSMGGAERVISISEFTKDAFIAKVSKRPSVVTCPLGLGNPSVASEPSLAPPAIYIGRKVILIVGRMVPGRNKGHRSLIRAMSLVRKEDNDALLCIVGRGSDESALKELTSRERVEDHVHFAGFVSDEQLRAYYMHCRVFAMPSDSEGFGLVYLEAMKEGRPCIGGNVDAAREVIVDGETGFLVSPNDYQPLATAILRCCHDQDLADRLGRTGRLRWERNFTLQAFSDRFAVLLSEIIDR